MPPDPVTPFHRVPLPEYVDGGEFVLKLALAWMVLCALRYAIIVTVSIVKENRCQRGSTTSPSSPSS